MKRLLIGLEWVAFADKVKDKVSWVMTKDDIFSIKLMYEAVQLGLNVSFLWKVV